MRGKKIIICACGLLVLLMAYSRFAVSSQRPSMSIVESVVKRLPKSADYLCLVNFGKFSGEERFFIYNVKDRKYVYSGLVQHGNGSGSTARKPVFSNVVGSNCSSLGLYKVISYDTMHTSSLVPCFRLKGMDATNSNALSRGILIHPSLTATLMPFEIWGLALPLTIESQGCFAVSCNTMWEISRRFKTNNMYLYAYKE